MKLTGLVLIGLTALPAFAGQSAIYSGDGKVPTNEIIISFGPAKDTFILSGKLRADDLRNDFQVLVKPMGSTSSKTYQGEGSYTVRFSSGNDYMGRPQETLRCSYRMVLTLKTSGKSANNKNIYQVWMNLPSLVPDTIDLSKGCPANPDYTELRKMWGPSTFVMM